MIAPDLVRGELPGAPLVLTLDGGGERWTLDGRQLHAGDGVELLTERLDADAGARWCGTCNGEGRAGAGEARRTCPDCGGRGYPFVPLWLPVRFEYSNAGDGTGSAYLYVRGPGLGGDLRHAIELRGSADGARVRCRWPVRGPR